MYQFPKCRKCGDGDLVPFSDFGSQGRPNPLQGWVCTNPIAVTTSRSRNGELYIDEPINDGQVHYSNRR
ncbi:MAG: hypothetical protein IPH65_16170 [Dehalococcoidia bacterium]|uniref:hypothetical protein n=1 Tax=Candidatus Amarobacter glycogenicus TaxID=3140699 RepID=UPI003136B80C|nr:hypothetical protein [Dehalococcoidia bacterium]